MIDTIKEVVQNMLEHWGLTDYVLATVTAVRPLELKIDERLYLTEANVLRTTSLGEVTYGEKIIMLRVLRGQKYILLSKVVA